MPLLSIHTGSCRDFLQEAGIAFAGVLLASVVELRISELILVLWICWVPHHFTNTGHAPQGSCAPLKHCSDTTLKHQT